MLSLVFSSLGYMESGGEGLPELPIRLLRAIRKEATFNKLGYDTINFYRDNIEGNLQIINHI
jgi:hypothetical protein